MCQSIWWSGQGLLHEQVSFTFDKMEALCILMQNEILLMYKFGIIAFKFIYILFAFTKLLWCGSLILVGISLSQQIQFNIKDSLEQTWSLYRGLTVPVFRVTQPYLNLLLKPRFFPGFLKKKIAFWKAKCLSKCIK